MKTYFRWYEHWYEIVNPSTKKARYFRSVFNAHRQHSGATLYDCYDRPSYHKQKAYENLVEMFSFVTVTGYNAFHFTAMATLDGVNALFVDTGRSGYVVADRTELKQFADALRVGFCEYREEK